MRLARVVIKAMTKNPGKPEAVVTAVTQELAAVFNEEIDLDPRVQESMFRIMTKLAGPAARPVERAS